MLCCAVHLCPDKLGLPAVMGMIQEQQMGVDSRHKRDE